jgi:hypothetical protein
LVGSSSFNYDALQRLTGITHSNGAGSTLANYSYNYNLASFLNSETYKGQTTNYTYDRANQLTNADRSLLNDGDNLWAELNQAEEIVNRYLQSANVDELIACYNSDEGTNWYLTDRLGTVRDVVNSVDNLINSFGYDSFGQIAGQTNPNLDDIAFAGREYDK